jgi:hypothetical protein
MAQSNFLSPVRLPFRHTGNCLLTIAYKNYEIVNFLPTLKTVGPRVHVSTHGSGCSYGFAIVVEMFRLVNGRSSFKASTERR